MTTCLGRGLAPVRSALQSKRSGLAPCRFETVDLHTFVGEITGVEDHRIPAQLEAFDCRNNRAADVALAQDGFICAVEAAARRHGSHRVGVFLGTSTSGILQAEPAYPPR